jgi:hypothetical protein
MNFVKLSIGTRGTSVTTKEQLAGRAGVAASVPLQDTVVGPRGKSAPDAGVHVIEIGSTPPLCVAGL